MKYRRVLSWAGLIVTMFILATILKDPILPHEQAITSFLRGLKEGKGSTLGVKSEEFKGKEKSITSLKKIVVLWTRWRSGSSFLGHLLSLATNSTFYSYEPLHMYDARILYKNDSTTLSALSYLKDLLSCRLQRHRDKVEYLAVQSFYMQENLFLWNQCKNVINRCQDPHFVEGVCEMAKLHVAKVLRLSLRWVRPLLEDSSLNVQILYLTRDPRAVYSSRTRVKWCKLPSCRDPEVLCSLLKEDLKEVVALQKEYPQRFKFLSYDHMCQNMSASLEDIMSFLSLPTSEKQRDSTRHASSSPSVHFARGNGIRQSQVWRLRASFPYVVQPVQRYCREALEKLGLRGFATRRDLLTLARSSIKRPPAVT